MNQTTAPKAPWQSSEYASLLQRYAALETVHTAQDVAAQALSVQLRTPLCVANCGLCCTINTPVITEIEARYIVASLFTVPTSKVLQRCEEWITRDIPGVTSITKAPEMRQLTDKERRSLSYEGQAVQQSQCPMLGEDKSCLIHSIRPISCRAWGVTKAAAPYCKRKRAVFESQNNLAYLTSAPQVQRAIKQLGNTGYCGFLPVLVYRLAKPKELQRLIEDGKVATAKLTLGNIQPWFVFESQTDDGSRVCF